MMGGHTLTEKAMQVSFVCMKCSKVTADIESERDPILLREYVTVFCHGESETFGLHADLVPGSEVQVFGAKG